MKIKFLLIAVGFLLVVFSYSFSQVPQMINYQGKLTKSTGAPLDTTVQMIFSIYADSNGTILNWTETQGAVKVDKGIFNVLLGSVTPISSSVFDGSVRYLGVKVGADPEITPRKPMVSVPYAYRAGSDAGARIATGTYTGNGQATQSITGIGFKPKVVVVGRKPGTYWNPASWDFKVDSMDSAYSIWCNGNLSGYVFSYLSQNDRGGDPMGFIASFDADGFTVGGATEPYSEMNSNGITYWYLAIG